MIKKRKHFRGLIPLFIQDNTYISFVILVTIVSFYIILILLPETLSFYDDFNENVENYINSFEEILPPDVVTTIEKAKLITDQQENNQFPEIKDVQSGIFKFSQNYVIFP